MKLKNSLKPMISVTLGFNPVRIKNYLDWEYINWNFTDHSSPNSNETSPAECFLRDSHLLQW